MLKKLNICLILLVCQNLAGQVLKPLDGGLPGKVTAICTESNNIYACYEKAADPGKAFISMWDGFVWNTIPGSITYPPIVSQPGATYEIASLAYYNGSLFAGGRLLNGTNMSKISHLWKLNGSTWENITAIQTSIFGISDMLVYNNELIVAGEFNEAGGVSATNIATYNGSSWNFLGKALDSQGTNGRITDLAVFNNNLYVAGTFDKFGGNFTGRIAKWTGTIWGGNGSAFNIGALALSSFNGELYCLGSDVIGETTLKKFNGNGWVVPSFVTDLGADSNKITSLMPGNGSLWVYGEFTNGGNHRLKKYSNGWSVFSKFNPGLNALLNSYKNHILIAGEYTAAQTVGFENIGLISEGMALVKGTVFNDANKNCTFDNPEATVGSRILTFTKLGDGEKFLAMADKNGKYEVYLKPGIYLADIGHRKYYSSSCGTIGSISVVSDQELNNVDFPELISPGIKDMNVGVFGYTGNQVLVGGVLKYRIKIENNGSSIINGETIHFSHDPRLGQFSSLPVASNYTSPDATFTINNLKPGEIQYIDITLKGTSLTVGDVLKNSIKTGTNATNSDNDKSDNYDTLNQKVVNDFANDGNYKICEQTIVNEKSTKINYGIYYKNISSATSVNVRILDTVDVSLDITKAGITGYNSDPKLSIADGKVIVVEYRNINLPSAESNETESRGFFEYYLGLNNTIANNTLIKNSAAITFDFKNAYTNQTVTQYLDSRVGIKNLNKNINFSIFPNPSSGMVFVENTYTKNHRLMVYNVNGMLVKTLEMGPLQTISFNSKVLVNGIYFIKSEFGGTTKFIVE